jgi:hypothetical protein
VKKTVASILFFLLLSNYAFAQNRCVLVEEFTGMWCGDCPKGRSASEHLDSLFGNQVICIGMHSGDSLSNGYSDGITKYCDVTEFPLAFIDRTSFPASGGVFQEIDPHEHNLDKFIQQQLMKISPLDIHLTNLYDSKTRLLTVQADFDFKQDWKGKMRVNCLVVEDSVQTNKAQVNYMNNDTTSPWYQKGNPVLNYVQRNVARNNLSAAIWGEGNVLPNLVLKNQHFSSTYSYTVPAAWNEQHIKLVCFVTAWGSGDGMVDTSKFNVLNTAVANLTRGPTTGLLVHPSARVSVRAYPNPFANSCTLQLTLLEEEAVVLRILNATGQEVALLETRNLPAGKHLFTWAGTSRDGSSLPNGLYFFHIHTATFSRAIELVLNR